MKIVSSMSSVGRSRKAPDAAVLDAVGWHACDRFRTMLVVIGFEARCSAS